MKYSNETNKLLEMMQHGNGIDESLFPYDALIQLFADRFVQHSPDFHDRNLHLTDKGLAYIEQLKKDEARYKEEKRRSWIQFWLPLVISTVSLIGAYRQEITWLLQELEKLSK